MNNRWLDECDFNDIDALLEEKGGAPTSIRKCNNFKYMINVCTLMDVGFVGSKFTWRKLMFHGGSHIFEILECVMLNYFN